MGLIVPFSSSEIEFIERKSRFIGNVWLVNSEEEAKRHIEETYQKHPTAAHGVYCYDIKAENVSRYNDNGEPKGTAGLPMFEVFRREGVTNYCCIATRYFGGILLGAGGLVRAYAATAKLALDAAGIAELCTYLEVTILCEYTHFNIIKAYLQDKEHTEIDIEYGADVTYTICIPEESFDVIQAGVIECTAGRSELLISGTRQIPVRRETKGSK